MNTSTPWAYNGPRFNYTYDTLAGAFGRLREQCGAHYGPGRQVWVQQVADCMLNNASQQMLANLNSHTYLCTLWPAFISLIVAMGADPAPVAYDSLPWALLLALTSASMPGFHSPPLPHQLTCRAGDAAAETCRGRIVDGSADAPDKISRFAKSRPSESYSDRRTEWALWAFGMALWMAFLAYYLYSLTAVTYMTIDQRWGWGAIWYMMAAVPALAEGVARVWCHNVDLYEPAQGNDAAASKPIGPAESYTRRKCTSGVRVWLRIAWLQWTGAEYRVLVHLMPHHPPMAAFEYVLYLGRMAIFVWGSITQGTFLFLLPGDIWLLVLVIIVTVTPRVLWPRLWKCSSAGADFVVWHTPVL